MPNLPRARFCSASLIYVGFLEQWQLSYDEINELLTANPSLRSFLQGYAAEMKCRTLWFSPDEPRVTNVKKYDDHDRTKKGDIAFEYQGYSFNVEVKSLQTNSIKEQSGQKVATFQCDASDRRPVNFPDGSSVETTCLLVGEFDLLAVNLFGFYNDWIFAFAKNSDLPRVSGRGRASSYTPYQREWLLASSMRMKDPPVEPYRMEPWSVLDELVEERAQGKPEAEVEIVTEDGREELVVKPETHVEPEDRTLF
jgi:hypothetical protein